MSDMIVSPVHYTSHPSGIEPIQFTRHMGFNLGNVLKYIVRADYKHDDGGLEDLRKAQTYIADEIALREGRVLKSPPIVLNATAIEDERLCSDQVSTADGYESVALFDGSGRLYEVDLRPLRGR